MGRHAYLIMAHNQFPLLKILLGLLDDKENDIYLHIDVKANIRDTEPFMQAVKSARIHLYQKMSVMWGEYSQVAVCLYLMEKALQDGVHDYYHTLSGVDLPIKTQAEIHSFFRSNAGKEFVQFESPVVTSSYLERVRYHHIPTHLVRTSSPVKRKAAHLSNLVYVSLQKGIGKDHLEPGIVYQKGANWYSITEALARYTVGKKQWLQNTFQHASFCDEFYMQTLVENSPFREALYNREYNDDYRACMRLVDWQRGNPYTFQKEDYQQLVESECLFARKFSMDVDSEIILMIQRKLSGEA